jgi:hypothetical protein
MSGILDRMAKRALGTLPSIQPLGLPSHAIASPARETAMPVAEFLEVDATLAGIPDEPLHAPEKKSQQTSRGPAIRTDSSEQASSGETKSRKQSGKPPTEVPAEDSAQRTERQARHAIMPEHSRGSTSVSNHAESAQGREHLVDNPGAREDARESMPPAMLPEPEEIERSAPEEPRMPRVEATPHGQPQRPRAAPQSESAAPTPQNTEIHISIGSIELRAPRTETRPQTIPFRPRVTLSDFLRRKPEAGA